MVLAHLQVLAEIARVDASLSTFVMVHASLAMLTIERMVGKISLPLSTRVLTRKKKQTFERSCASAQCSARHQIW